MGKLREDGLFRNPRWHSGPFAGIHLGGAMQNNGVKVEHPLMIVNVATNPTEDETIGIGTKTYTFKDIDTAGDCITIGSTAALTALAIIAKINIDNADGTGCSAYSLGKDTYILLVDNLSQSHHSSPAWVNDGAKVVELVQWMEEVPQYMLNQTDYFAIDNTSDTDAKPIKLVERNKGSYQNFLY